MNSPQNMIDGYLSWPLRKRRVKNQSWWDLNIISNKKIIFVTNENYLLSEEFVIRIDIIFNFYWNSWKCFRIKILDTFERERKRNLIDKDLVLKINYIYLLNTTNKNFNVFQYLNLIYYLSIYIFSLVSVTQLRLCWSILISSVVSQLYRTHYFDNIEAWRKR